MEKYAGQLNFQKAYERRLWLGKRILELKVKKSPNMLRCVCGEIDQIQLIGYINTIPARWKCRRCKQQFEWEPEKE